jgi:hypothetical protein
MLLGALLGQVLDGQLQPVERLDLVRQHAGHAAALLRLGVSGFRRGHFSHRLSTTAALVTWFGSVG